MTNIKSPQTISHTRKPSQGGGSFTILLLVFTWAVIGILFYGVKSGSLLPDNNAAATKISELEGKLSSVDERVAALEKRLNDAASVLSPGGAAGAPGAPGAPGMDPNHPPLPPMDPAHPGDAPKPGDAPVGAAPTPPAPGAGIAPDSAAPAPGAPAPDAAAPKPQTNNRDTKYNHASVEKKSSDLTAKKLASNQ